MQSTVVLDAGRPLPGCHDDFYMAVSQTSNQAGGLRTFRDVSGRSARRPYVDRELDAEVGRGANERLQSLIDFAALQTSDPGLLHAEALGKLHVARGNRSTGRRR